MTTALEVAQLQRLRRTQRVLRALGGSRRPAGASAIPDTASELRKLRSAVRRRRRAARKNALGVALLDEKIAAIQLAPLLGSALGGTRRLRIAQSAKIGDTVLPEGLELEVIEQVDLASTVLPMLLGPQGEVPRGPLDSNALTSERLQRLRR